MSQQEPVGILERRRLEALVIKPIYEILKRELGLEKTRAILTEAIQKSAIEQGKEFRALEGGKTSLQSFIDLQVLWEKDGALDVEVYEANDNVYDYDVTRCQYAEMYKDLGLHEIGDILSCLRDYYFTDGYCPTISLTRETTIMSGCARCTFRYKNTPK
ncbi:L-2-amino-thiazoline-4-carboxylic acid hydrolase [Acetobacteraceae bacterium ESL0709]|nr:L-2-amino-thiazoline-4-carboxylic acid hydrolase [Acetobacteraceae bacterium ESL0697]MDF7677896.1 L-2-amino-thiazoline-4-carboxylic acid hydrolase [Acetobacteraceae bacterium ESL0709]